MSDIFARNGAMTWCLAVTKESTELGSDCFSQLQTQNPFVGFAMITQHSNGFAKQNLLLSLLVSQ